MEIRAAGDEAEARVAELRRPRFGKPIRQCVQFRDRLMHFCGEFPVGDRPFLGRGADRGSEVFEFAISFGKRAQVAAADCIEKFAVAVGRRDQQPFLTVETCQQPGGCYRE